MDNTDYTAKQIQVLEGLEPVRKRPGMYIGSTDSRGLHECLREIVDNSVTGYVTQATPESIAQGIIMAIRHNKNLRENIKSNYYKLKSKFQEENVKQYIKIYETLV